MLDDFLPRLLRDAFVDELFQMLPRGDFCGSASTLKRFCNALTHPGMPSCSLSGTLLIDHLKLCPSVRWQRPLFANIGDDRNSLRFAVPPAMAGSLAVLMYLKERNAGVCTDYHFSHSREIADKMLNGSLEATHDGCVMALAVAAQNGLLSANSRSKFRPIMLMPQTSHRVLASGHDESWDGEYHFMSDTPGTSAVYYEELLATRQVKKQRAHVTHCEPDKVSGIFKSGSLGARAIIWFPHYHLITSLCGASVIDSMKDSLAHQGTLMFVHERIARDAALVMSIQSEVLAAWSELAKSKIAMQCIAERLTGDRAYCSFLARCGGFSSSFEGSMPSHMVASTAIERFRVARA